MSHDGRGVARREDGAHAGKAMFVSGALPGETVMVEQSGRSRQYDEGRAVEILSASPDRVSPKCPHFGVCSGCVLQHLDADKQIGLKQQELLDNLQRIGHVTPQEVLAPLADTSWGYRRKGRFSVRHVLKKGKTLVGFRELDPRFVADIQSCHTVIPEIGMKVGVLAEMIDQLDARGDIPQVEFIAGDDTIALVFRHLQALSEGDIEKLKRFGEAHNFAIYLQPGGVASVHPLSPDASRLAYALKSWDVELEFKPLDFIQVNRGLNEKMIAHALGLLAPEAGERILDLFCGLGNFTLPLARVAEEVVGVEGDAGLVQRARDNATRNGLSNVQFHAADLSEPLQNQAWIKQTFDRLLLDPARAGAESVLKQLPLDGLKRIVYVSCHPGSLARDAGWLVNEAGWTLTKAGVMDMFPHTAHVESIAVFEKGR